MLEYCCVVSCFLIFFHVLSDLSHKNKQQQHSCTNTINGPGTSDGILKILKSKVYLVTFRPHSSWFLPSMAVLLIKYVSLQVSLMSMQQ